MNLSKNTSNYVKVTLLSVIFVSVFFLSPVYADLFTVTNYNSSGAGSLSTAIDGLNTSGVAGTIEFNEASASGTIDLSGYTTSLGYETVFDLNTYNVTLQNYAGGCGSWTKFNGDAGGVLNIGSGSTWSNGWGIVIGDGTTGVLTVSNGGDFSVSNGGTYIGSTSGDANGSLTVTGSGSTYTDNNNVYIGNSGTGALTVSSGATMTASKDIFAGYNSGSTGTITVTGSGSSFSGRDMYLGYDGNLDLTVSDGATMSGSFVAICFHSSSSGTINVTGEGSLFRATSGMYVGYDGDCDMTISDGADATADEGYVGSNSGSNSSLTITGSGSTFTSANSMYIGCWDTGALTISDGGALGNTAGIVGRGSDATGTVTLTGSGSTWTNSTLLTIGEDGDGTVTISDAAVLNVAGGAGTVRLALNSGSSGILNIGSGAAAGTLNAATVTGGSGTAVLNLNLTDEDYTLGANLTGSLGVTKSGSGVANLTGTNTYTGGTTINAGAINAKDDGVLGTGDITINDGGCLLLGTVGDESGTIALSNNITVSGDGNTGIGAINNAGGTNTLSGTVTTDANATIGSIGDYLVFTGNISSTGNYDLTFTGESDVGVEGVIGIGSGSVIKNGTGALFLSGSNTYTGGTSLDVGGIVAMNSSAFGTGNVTIADEATLVLDGSLGDVTIANNITSVQGTGPSIYGAIVSADGDNTISGAITQAGNTTIYADNNSLTLSGAIGGAHDLTLSGDGVINLSGANTYTGATIINANTVNAGIADQALGAGSDVTVNEGATLSLNNFNETIGSLSGSGTVNNGGAADRTLTIGNVPLGYGSTSVTFSGLLTDGGAGKFSLTKDGAGTLILTGANTYSGTTTIDNGVLQVSNQHALGSGAVTNNSELDIGLTNLAFNGVYTQAAGSSLKLSAASATSYGSIISSSNAVVSSASSINVTVGGYLPNKATFKVIDGTGGAGVEVPSTITSSSTKYKLIGSSVDGDLILTVDRSGTGYGFASEANNANGAAAGAVLDNINNPQGQMLTILDTLEYMSPVEVGQSLDTLTPTVDSGILNVSNTSLNQFIGTSNLRLGGLFARARQAEETGISAGDPSLKGLDAWGRGFGEYLKQDARGFSNGYRATVWGTALGGDIPVFGDKARLGLSGGYAQSDINSKDNSGSTDIDSYQGTFYGGYIDPQNPYYLNGSFSFAYNKYEGKRHVAVGTITSIADSDYDGQQYSVMLDGGYVMNAGKFKVIPLASLQYMRLHLQSYTETGAGALNLSVKAQNYDMLQSGLGMKLERPFEAKGMTVIPEFHAKWLYDFIGDRQETTSTFAGGGGSFATNGFDPAQNSLNVGAKLTLASHNNWSIETNYDFEYKEDFTAHTGWADIKYKF